jgi:hypothetical protein
MFMTSWERATIKPGDAAIQALREHWHWMLGNDWHPILFSAIGDIFFSVAAGSVWWLSTATGSLENVAESSAHFFELLKSESTDEWFLPGLAEALRSHGRPLAVDECYSYRVFPVFERGSFSVENMYVALTAEHFASSGRLHESIRSLPDGAEAMICAAEAAR